MRRAGRRTGFSGASAWCAAAALGALLPGTGTAATGRAPPQNSPLPLHECRIEHPLRLASIAARCGVLDVPLDRTHPGASIELAIAVVPALDRRSAAPPLLVIAGGPGQGAQAMYASLAGAFARVNRTHDIVLVDQRGTGGSAPASCDYPEDWRSDDPLPLLREATLDCLKKYGPSVRFYTTTEAVSDLDAVRRALKVPAVDLYAASYGTRVAQLYMRRFPTAVRAVVLDGVTFPEQLIGPDTPFDGERALELIVARCRRSADCDQAFPDLQQELDALRRRFGPQKAALTIDDPSSGLPLDIEFNRGLLNASLRLLSYSAGQAALIPALVHRATEGGLGALAAQTVMANRLLGGQIASGMQNSVICSEDVPFWPAALDRASMTRTYQGTDQLDAFLAICKLWPRGPVDAELHNPLQSDIPTLLLSGEADPVTPPADAERAALGLARHRHLILSGEGHGQLATGCVPRLMAEFLASEAPETLDASCLQRHQAAPFFVSLTGPAP